MGVSLSDVFNTLQVYLGSLYVNDFNQFGRTWQVNVQADPPFRRQIEDLKQLKVRNAQGEMVPLGIACHGARRQRPGADRPLQHVPGGADQRQPGPGRQLRPGHRDDGGPGRRARSAGRCATSGPS